MAALYTASLSASAIRYLLVIQSFSNNQESSQIAMQSRGRGVRSSAIADGMGVSRPSVHKMMESLSKAGLIHKDGYGAVFFTEEGENLAGLYEVCFERLADRLRGILPEDTDFIQAICMLLSVMTLEGLKELGS